VPQSEGKALALLESRSVIVTRHYGENELVELEVDAPESLLRRLSRFVVDGSSRARQLRAPGRSARRKRQPSAGQ
jgi:hypothetical protein